MTDVLAQRLATVIVNHDGTMVQLIVDGKCVLNMPHDHALIIARALYKHAKLAEELAAAEQVIMDQAILMRSGWPFAALSANPAIINEAGKEAAWNSRLRRFIANKLDPRGVVFPLVVRHAPKPK